MHSIPKNSGRTDVRLMLGLENPKHNHEWTKFEVGVTTLVTGYGRLIRENSGLPGRHTRG